MTDAAPEPLGSDPESAPAPVRAWPPGRPFDPATAIAVDCWTCATAWRMHQSMAGFRLRCDCGSWIDVPPIATATAPTLLADVPGTFATPAIAATDATPTAAVARVTNQRLIPTSLPMAPGSLAHGNVRTRATWTNRALLEFLVAMAAILGPQLLALLLASGDEAELLMPFASLVSCCLVVMLGFASGPYVALGLHGVPLRRYVDALAFAAIAYGLATGYMMALIALLGDEVDGSGDLATLVDRLGAPWAVVVVAMTPALAEEIAFRGMLQGRLMALFGYREGLIVTAITFTLCHLQPAVMPVHLGLGLLLGVLRERNQSLLPGMLLHFVYNAAVLLVPC